MSRNVAWALFALLPLGGACQRTQPQDGAAPPPAESAAAGGAHDHAAAAPDAPGAAAGEAQALPLRPIMQQLATAMAGITQALWTEDYEAMAGHAEHIAGHSLIAPAELDRIGTSLGADTAGFNAADEAVHEASLRLRDAVRAHDRDAILNRLAEVQAGCVACHTGFRPRLRTVAQP